jgi:hypothetical protein
MSSQFGEKIGATDLLGRGGNRGNSSLLAALNLRTIDAIRVRHEVMN